MGAYKSSTYSLVNLARLISSSIDMSPRPLKSSLTLQIDDRGAQLRAPEGAVLGTLPEAKAGPERRAAWAAALRELAAPGTEVALINGGGASYASFMSGG